MKFKLPRQILNKEITPAIVREIKKQNTELVRANKNNLKEVAQVLKSIESKGIPNHLICKKLPHNLGKGIFLHPDAEPILKDQVIAPYAGEICLIPQKGDDGDGSYAFVPLENIFLKKQEQRLVDKTSTYRPGRLYSLKIDAMKTGNFTRFINHSEKPNIVAHLFKIQPNRYGVETSPIEIIYIAKKKILPGEQLLICYEDEEKSYWGVAKIKPFPMTPKTFRINRSLEIATDSN
jgi:hypothetical protein